eukprot:4820643-Heterocapsa_arctica.AAC.1
MFFPPTPWHAGLWGAPGRNPRDLWRELPGTEAYSRWCPSCALAQPRHHPLLGEDPVATGCPVYRSWKTR